MCIYYDHVLIIIKNDAFTCTLYSYYLKCPIQMFIFSLPLNFSIRNGNFLTPLLLAIYYVHTL